MDRHTVTRTDNYINRISGYCVPYILTPLLVASLKWVSIFLFVESFECLRYNINQQYTPGNGYTGQYRWDSGEPFDFHDFIGNPGEDPHIHLTPDNNYQWNTKNDQDDKNNGCLCKSEELNTNVKVKTSLILGFKSMVLITAFNSAIFWFVRFRQSINAFLAY